MFSSFSGNLIADAFVDWRAANVDSGEYWTDAAIGMINGGAIRASIDLPGNITMESLITILPFNSIVQVVEITGKELYEVFERSVYRYDNGLDNGEFAQFSGVQVKYDINRPRGKRVTEVKVVCAKCAVPALVDIDLDEKYRVILQNFVAEGGDGYQMFVGKTVYNSEKLDTDVVIEYLAKKSPVAPAEEWRLSVEQLLDRHEVVGMTKVKLDHSECMTHECNIGNLVVDSIVDFYAAQHNASEYWTDAPIALISAKNLRETLQRDSEITRDDVLKILGSIEYLHVKEISGTELKNIFEYAVSHDEFLQVSGLEVKIDMNKAPGNRVTSLKALCTECQSPDMEMVIDSKKYKVLMQASLAFGSDGFDTVYENQQSTEIQETDLEIVIKYIKKRSPVYPAVEWRIEVTERDPAQTTEPPVTGSTDDTSSVTTTDSTTTTTQGAATLMTSIVLFVFSLMLSVKF